MPDLAPFEEVGIVPSPAQQFAEIVMQLLLDGILFPVQREFYAQAAVALAAVARDHHQLVAREELRVAAHGGHQRHDEFHLGRILPDHVSDAVGVVVAREDHHVPGIVDVGVVGDGVIPLGDAFVPVLVVGVDGLADGGLQAEVHDAREVGIESVRVGVENRHLSRLFAFLY